MSVSIIKRSIWNNPGNQGQKLSRTAYAFGWQLWKRLIRTPLDLTLPNGRKFVAHPDCVVSSSLIYSQFPEYYELNLVRKSLQPADILIDIGANVGHVGLLLSDLVPPENILAFEPTPFTFTRLRENWTVNQFATNGLHQVAIGEETGIARFPNLQHPGTMNAQVSEEAGLDAATVEVPIFPLDHYRGLWTSKSIGFLKIDVEGHEGPVFRGARKTLAEDRPRLIMFESLDGSISSQVGAELSTSDYRLFQLDDKGNLIPDASTNQNVFAAPSESFDEIINL